MTRIPLPQVKRETINRIVGPVMDFDKMEVNREQIKKYLYEIDEDNPTISALMGRVGKMMSLVQRLGLSCDWFALVGMIVMYKALEEAHANKKALEN